MLAAADEDLIAEAVVLHPAAAGDDIPQIAVEHRHRDRTVERIEAQLLFPLLQQGVRPFPLAQFALDIPAHRVERAAEPADLIRPV